MEQKRLQPIYDYQDYRQYLTAALPTSGPKRGIRSQLAEALRCQTAFVSRVLHGLADFSLEHAVAISRFLSHSDDEAEYFVLLVHHARAGSADLRAHYEKRIQLILDKRKRISERIAVRKELSREDQMTYYSAWYYSAIHVLLLIPSMRTQAAISGALGVQPSIVSKVLAFLCGAGLAIEESPGVFRSGEARIHLGKDSPMISKHHANWRVRSMQVFERDSPEDLFFSGPICISEKDAAKLRELLLKTLTEAESVIRPSPEEAAFCLSMDFFRL